MKKKTLGALSVVMLAATLMFCGCSQTVLNYAENNISEVRHNIFEGETENYYITFSSGQREEPYLLNGVSEDKVSFGVVSVLPKAGVEIKSASFVVNVNDTKHSGELEASPFDDTFAADIEKSVSEADELSIEITCKGQTQTAEMVCISCDFSIKSDKALEIAVDELSAELATLTDNGNIAMEVYIKIITDADKTIGAHFWFVSFINSEGAELSIIVAPDSGEIIAKKL